MTSVVVVESPAKAKTINKYLGRDFTVLASYGHIRDLPSKDGSVRPDDGFEMDWEVDAKSQKHVKAITDALKGADKLYLATDPDREGEAISWHVCQVLEKKRALKDVDVKRVVFNEVTKSAILEAFEHPRELNRELVDAYLARRALDYLVGFTLSPVLWRKLPGSKSAGRVQSVALRLISEREAEIEAFKPTEYWSVAAKFTTPRGAAFTAQLTHLDGKKLAKLDLGDAAAAERAKAAIEAGQFSVAKVEKKQTKRNPAPPFTTSTLQQEASRKLGFSASRTMQVAQKLYEGVPFKGETVGMITYMRTDGVQMASEAIAGCRDLIQNQHGDRYLPEKPRIYKSKAKNAQEAHEAIRPTDVSRTPESLAPFLDTDLLKLYTLIWKRTVASQMATALIDKVGVDLSAGGGQVQCRATGSTIAFDGFIKLYREGLDEAADQDREGDDGGLLPEMAEGEAVERREVTADQHFTQPPPRFSEASLVKKLEELGIGRPSTYASILSVLQARNYVRLESKRFIPEDRGRLVTAFLASFFERYVAYSFTAQLEEQLDDISGGRRDWKQVLEEFWTAFQAAVKETEGLRVSHVLDVINDLLGPHFFPVTEQNPEPRKCPSCSDGTLSLKLGKFGAFVGCSNYPECKHTRPLEVIDENAGAAAADAFPRVLGEDPKTGLEVTVRKGPYGFYVQLGDAASLAALQPDPPPDAPKKKGKAEEKAPKPKRASLAKDMDPLEIKLDAALKLLALPREIGADPETGEMISAGIGRFGPYVKRGDIYVSLKGDDNVLTIGLNRAAVLVAEKALKNPSKDLGAHPKDGKPVKLKTGRFGPYVQHGRTMANVPKGVDKETVDLEQAVALIAAKADKKGGKKAAPKKTAAKKPAAKKTGTKKKTTAKSASKTAVG